MPQDLQARAVIRVWYEGRKGRNGSYPLGYNAKDV
jgi:hypothetical protein